MCELHCNFWIHLQQRGDYDTVAWQGGWCASDRPDGEYMAAMRRAIKKLSPVVRMH
jgi:hypothetical protein